jgi:hypothetical protein
MMNLQNYGEEFIFRRGMLCNPDVLEEHFALILRVEE